MQGTVDRDGVAVPLPSGRSLSCRGDRRISWWVTDTHMAVHARRGGTRGFSSGGAWECGSQGGLLGEVMSELPFEELSRRRGRKLADRCVHSRACPARLLVGW